MVIPLKLTLSSASYFDRINAYFLATTVSDATNSVCDARQYFPQIKSNTHPTVGAYFTPNPAHNTGTGIVAQWRGHNQWVAELVAQFDLIRNTLLFMWVPDFQVTDPACGRTEVPDQSRSCSWCFLFLVDVPSVQNKFNCSKNRPLRIVWT